MKTPFLHLFDKNVITILGLMSGTSADGLDICRVRFDGRDRYPLYEVLATHFVPYPESFSSAFKHPLELSASDIARLNMELGKWVGKTIETYTGSCDAIANHGQTLLHRPPDYTLQIGEATCIAQICGLPVIYDFRKADVCLGGQGAPLIPIVDDYLLRRENTSIIALNMGGIANLTYLPPRGSNEPILAWDTGPANTLIDKAVIDFTHGKENYDDKGEYARKGTLNSDLLHYMMEHPYFKQNPPKSAGQEQFGDNYYHTLKSHISLKHKHDWLSFIRTLTELTVLSIKQEIHSHIRVDETLSTIYASGGGAENDFIMQGLREEFSDMDVVKFDLPGIDSNIKEAFGFAYLGYLFLRNLSGNIPSVTGASKATVLGKMIKR